MQGQRLEKQKCLLVCLHRDKIAFWTVAAVTSETEEEVTCKVWGVSRINSDTKLMFIEGTQRTLVYLCSRKDRKTTWPSQVFTSEETDCEESQRVQKWIRDIAEWPEVIHCADRNKNLNCCWLNYNWILIWTNTLTLIVNITQKLHNHILDCFGAVIGQFLMVLHWHLVDKGPSGI